MASFCSGTLNKRDDKDRYWTTEISVSRKAVGMSGGKFPPEKVWLILLGRYNYTHILKRPELSCYPYLSEFDFHCLKDYAKIIFDGKPDSLTTKTIKNNKQL